jgi:hypothetical protein
VPRPNFNDELSLSKAPFEAAGPIAPTQRLDWVWVWIVQNRPNRAAAARGGGAGPFGPPAKEWRVPIQMAPNSDPFKPDWAALATAVALVREGGSTEAYWWSEAIMIRP